MSTRISEPSTRAWAKGADEIAPTLVGGSKKHGGPDLGDTSDPARSTEDLERWAVMVDQGYTWDTLPAKLEKEQYVDLLPAGGTAAYRQVGNAFPPPVARAVAASLRKAIEIRKIHRIAS